MTAVQNFLSHLDSAALARREETAAKNGMTLAQVAASELVGRAATESAECRAVLADREKALTALDRIAAVEEVDKGSCYIPTDLLIKTILA